MVEELLFIRHGETDWNRDRRVQGQIDVPLNDVGLAQAARLADHVRELGVEAVVTSDLLRARQTAELIAGADVPLLLEARLREAGFGAFEGLSVEEMLDRYPEEYAAWRSDPLASRPPGGETIEELRHRAMVGLADAIAGLTEDRRVAVVTHGGTVRALVCGMLGLPLFGYSRLRVDNCSISRILLSDRGPMLTGFNDTWHLRRKETGVAGAGGWEER